MEDGEAAGGAGPGRVGGFDAFEADQAGEGAGARGGEERLDFDEILMLVIVAAAAAARRGMGEIGLEDGGGEVGVALMQMGEGGCIGVGIGVGGELRRRGGGG